MSKPRKLCGEYELADHVQRQAKKVQRRFADLDYTLGCDNTADVARQAGKDATALQHAAEDLARALYELQTGRKL